MRPCMLFGRQVGWNTDVRFILSRDAVGRGRWRPLCFFTQREGRVGLIACVSLAAGPVLGSNFSESALQSLGGDGVLEAWPYNQTSIQFF